jgi:hypothetical protein
MLCREQKVISKRIYEKPQKNQKELTKNDSGPFSYAGYLSFKKKHDIFRRRFSDTNRPLVNNQRVTTPQNIEGREIMGHYEAARHKAPG